MQIDEKPVWVEKGFHTWVRHVILVLILAINSVRADKINRKSK